MWTQRRRGNCLGGKVGFICKFGERRTEFSREDGEISAFGIRMAA